jgi:hypothetical protein
MRHLLLVFFSLMALLAGQTAHASIAYGSINNFDTVNDTGHECHGFEIEIEDCHSTDVTYTYNYNHYGAPRVEQDDADPVHPKCRIRWESKKNADGTWAAYTAIPSGPINPTDGHQFTNPNVNFGGEHFGAGFRLAVGIIRYNWLIDNGSGVLVHGGAVQVATPVFTYYPPVVGVAAQVQAVIVPPEPPLPPVKEFGKAVWVKEIKTTTHNNREIKLRELVSDDPADANEKNWANGEPDEVEVEWRILQKKTSAADGGPNGELAAAPEDLPNGDEVVTRRYEFYKYTGPLDAESGEAMADSVDPDGLHGEGMRTYNHHLAAGEWVTVTEDMATYEVIGDFTGSQMAAVDVDAPVGLIDHVGEGRINTAFAGRTVVIEGALPFTSLLEGALPAGMTFDEVTGILDGTPTVSGEFQFKITASDGLNPDVSKNYTLLIAAAGAELPPSSLLDTTVSPVGSGTTTGDDSYAIGADASVTATAEPGYTFLNWTDNGEIVSTNSSYTLAMNVNHSLIAHFAPAVDQRTITTSATPVAGGSTSGGGTFAVGSSVNLSATANAGYSFVNWTEGGLVVSNQSSYTFLATANRALVANFTAVGGGNLRTITAVTSPLAGGTVSGAGSFAEGTSVTLTAHNHAGYAFTKWKEGAIELGNLNSLTFTVASNRVITAVFVPALSIAVSASPPEGGVVEPDAPSYEVGDSADVQADANPGYTFVNWTEDGVEVSTDPKYIFEITTSRTLVGHFISQGNVTISLSGSPAEGGVVSGGGSRVIGAPVTALAAAAAGYKFTHWTEGAATVSTDKDYQFPASVGRSLVAHFILLPVNQIHETEDPDEMEFEWPETSDGWVLQESTDLIHWVNSTRPVSIAGGKKRARVNTIQVPGVFFRLVKP